jgi:hypothetical protein
MHGQGFSMKNMSALSERTLPLFMFGAVGNENAIAFMIGYGAIDC